MNADLRSNAWQPHPWLARGVRLLSFLLPIALSIFVTRALAESVPKPAELAGRVGWFVVLAVSGTAVLYSAELLLRRLAPLGTLLKMTLVFPDNAPARFSVALRTGTPKQLARRVQNAREFGLGDTPQAAAEHLLELVAALNEHDRLTRGHCERVRAYTDMIATEMGLDEHARSKLHWAGMIHDIGKLEVPSAILSKPTRLTEEEFEIVKRHPDAGARLAEPLKDWLGEWFHAIDQHHERWDGRGYPRGLGGNDIALAGRIVAVADVFDVITAARSYKKPQPAAQARAELARCAGGQFDPMVVRAFLGISLGKLRLMLGPFAWLSELGALGRLPASAATSTAAGAVTAMSIAVMGAFGWNESVPTVAAPAVADVIQVVDGPPAGTNLMFADQTTTSPPPIVSPAISTTTIATSSPPPSTSAPTTSAPTVNEPPTSAPTTSTTTPPSADPVVSVASAVDDAVSLPEDTMTTVDVLANDRGDDLHLTSVEPGSGLTAELVDGRISVGGEPNFVGMAIVRYTAEPPVGDRISGRLVVSVTPVNDAPEFQVGAPVVAAEDSGSQSHVGWVTEVSAGPGEAGQSVTFAVEVDDPSLFAVAPSLSAAGTLTYTPADDANGTTTLRITATDDEGADSEVQVSSLQITAVNDAPSFWYAVDTTVDEDGGVAGADSRSSWATSISPGPANEAAQTVSFAVVAEQAELFSTPPTLSPTGLLEFTLAPHANGTTTLYVVAIDSEGTSSAEATAQFTVTAVQDPPTAREDAYLINDGIGISITTAELLANDTDYDDDALSVVSASLTASPSGNLVVFVGTRLTYVPGLFTGTDTIDYVITDGTFNVSGTITITVSSTTNETHFYLQPGAPSASQWALSTTTAPGAAVPDYDLDGQPGLTIASSGGNQDEDDPAKFQDWAVVPPSTLALNGPVVLDLWSTVEGFDGQDDAHIHAYLDRCDSDGVNCTPLLSLDLHVDEWNQGLSTWNRRSFTLGTVSTTIANTQMLRVRLLFGHKDVWVALNTSYPTALVLPIDGP